ncbi:polynucleotide adenylyltransferase PcnB [Stenoxybacter acetivorans]|uniref:polynucleotide adenylyltransferase PcnB n=1 Tax=Stenoxybacter acetivorans TaxID=422441 RepID=UPI000569666F|nr:polynucleotide adenylyltransferase PcnB [Stenoxybacter acetivorans]
MLKKWLHKVLPKRSAKHAAHKQVLPLSEHHIHADTISFAAEKVISRLQQAGFQAFVVGGAVRDLLLGIEPKDFDVATDATPEEVHKLFRRSRIIGRRFPIVHVMVGSETIEVTTFRGGNIHSHNELGRIMKDASFGTMAQDAARRDFTCNALYYDPTHQVVLDYHHGVADVRAKRLVMIGKPEARYLEDPVRMLRAARLSGKLGFEVDADTAAPIAQCAALLQREPIARLFDEIMKIIFSGSAQACLEQINRLGLGGKAHPLLDALLTAADDNNNIASLALHNTDRRLRADQSVSVGFVLAAVFWPQLYSSWQEKQQQTKAAPALNEAISMMRERMDKGWGIPQRFSATMREIWLLQPQFEYRRGARPFRLLTQPRFRAAFDFLVLRSQADEIDAEIVDWWQRFQHADDTERETMIQAAQATEADAPKKKRRRKPKKKPADATSES